jgi:D-lactate dehydrogenase
MKDVWMTTVAVYDTKGYDRAALSAAAGGDSIDWRFFDFRLGPDSVHAAAEAQAVCIFVNDVADRSVLEKLAEMDISLLALRCTGFNNVDLDAAKALGVTVTRVPVYSPYAVAEHVVALLLGLNRKIYRAYNRVREMNFSLNGLVGFDLYGKTAGIFGTGKIGKITAQIFRGFGMQVLAFDPFPQPQWAEEFGVRYVDLETLAAQSDVVSLHVPLTPETHYLIRRETLALMKRGVIIINVSRGALIDTTALIEALKSGHVGGVGLDVYEEEEGVFFEDLSGQVLQDDELARLITFPNVLITAHQAFLTEEALSDIARTTVTNLLAFSRGGAFVEGSLLV